MTDKKIDAPIERKTVTREQIYDALSRNLVLLADNAEELGDSIDGIASDLGLDIADGQTENHD